jgi:urease accessory protein
MKTASIASAWLEVALVAGQSTVTSAYASSPLKLLTPRSRSKSVWAYTSSFGGGLLGGDQTSLSVRVGAGARCFLSTQATTKIYRNPACLPCAHGTLADVEKDALLVFAPDRVQPFAGSTYSQRQEWHLEEGAGLVLLDWFCSGRMARNERWQFSRFQSRNDVFVGKRRVFVDSILLENFESPAGGSYRVEGFDCFAMLLFIGSPVGACSSEILNDLAGRPITANASLLCSASPVQDGVLVRVAGADAEEVALEIGKHLRLVNSLLGDNPWARKW